MHSFFLCCKLSVVSQQRCHVTNECRPLTPSLLCLLKWNLGTDLARSTTQKGKVSIVCGGYTMRYVGSVKDGSMNWRCTNKACCAWVHTDPAIKRIVKISLPHTHSPSSRLVDPIMGRQREKQIRRQTALRQNLQLIDMPDIGGGAPQPPAQLSKPAASEQAVTSTEEGLKDEKTAIDAELAATDPELAATGAELTAADAFQQITDMSQIEQISSTEPSYVSVLQASMGRGGEAVTYYTTDEPIDSENIQTIVVEVVNQS